jgi:lipid II isoglutaminyl synthase (glutamine-hydrolysing)
MDTLTIAHLYPDDMNIYGDSGNIVALLKRLQWRGYHCEVLDVQPGRAFDFHRADIVFGGGGQDSGQRRIGPDLADRGDQLRSAAADGLPMLLVCGLYQLFGVGFLTETGHHIDGIGVFRAATHASPTRLIGNIAIKSPFGTLVGFENHSGQTTLFPDQQPLGQVLRGWGNNDQTQCEGAITHNAIGTYLHGPVLPKNPALTDHLILCALRRRGLAQELAPLNDDLESAAASAASRRPQKMPNHMTVSRSPRRSSSRSTPGDG